MNTKNRLAVVVSILALALSTLDCDSGTCPARLRNRIACQRSGLLPVSM